MICERVEHLYKPVRIMPVSSPSTLEGLRSACDAGDQLVSVRSVAHAQWLKQQMVKLAPNLCQQTNGVPLGWDVNNNNQYYDLSDTSREITPIFAQLKKEGWAGDYETMQSGQ